MFEYLKEMWDSGLIMTLFTGVVVPVGAVYLSVKVTNNWAKKKQLKDEFIQREKLLKMLKHELQTVLEHYEQENKYYSRETLTGKLIIESPCFNTSDHQELLNKLWEYMRGYQSLNTAIESIPMINSPIQTVILDSSRDKTGTIDVEKYNEYLTRMNNQLDRFFDETVQYIIIAAKPLLKEVEKQIKFCERK